MSNAPIGIFDSGVGGLTVARAILDQLPNESTLYIGDTARGPYGPRPLAEVREFSLELMDYLVAQGVKAIVIACNTASAAMLRDARERYSIPVIEVIQPAVRRAVAASRTGRIGVIGMAADVDTLVLGCTHYPLLTGVISYVMGNNVSLVSSAEETAKDLYRILVESDSLRTDTSSPATHRFLATGDAAAFESLARRFLGPEVGKVEHQSLS
jgi:glutamate racemase